MANSRAKFFQLNIYAFMMLLQLSVVGCERSDVSWAPTASFSAMSVNAPSITLASGSGQSYQIIPSGGSGSYSYSVISGSGTVDSSGFYTAGAVGSHTVVRSSDSVGNHVDTSVFLTPILTNGSIGAFAIDSSGNRYFGGSFSVVNHYPAHAAIALKTSDGLPELAFDLQGGFDGSISTMVRDQNSGALYLAGGFTTYRGTPVRSIVKLNSLGVLDTTFNTGTGFTGGVNALALSPDGTALYAGGLFTDYRGVASSAKYLAKLSTTDASLDTTFYPNSASGGFDSYVLTLAVSPDGAALYVGGLFSAYRGVANSAGKIAKLSTTDGSLDTTFHPNSATGGFNGFPNSFAINSSGTVIYVGGSFTTYRGTANSARNVAKLSTGDGSLDTTFHPISSTGGFDSAVYSVKLDPTNSSLYVGGSFATYRGVTNSASRIAKLSVSDGSLDTTFYPNSSSGGFGSSYVKSLTLNSDGTKLYVGSYFTGYRGLADSAHYIAKLSTSDGNIDSTFQPVSVTAGFDSFPNALVLSADESTLYAAGLFTKYRGIAANNIVKYNASNVLDTNFNTDGSGFNGIVSSLALNAAGTSLYVGGQFTTYRNALNSAHYIAKLSTIDGSADTTFHPIAASGGFDSYVNALTLDAAGANLYVGGQFFTYRGAANSAHAIAKLSTSNGNLDTTFYPSSATGGFDRNGFGFLQATVYSLLLNSSGSTLYVGGYFGKYRGASDSAGNIAKLQTTNGNIDTTFHPVSASGGFDNNVYSLALDSTESSLYVGGDFGSYRGTLNNAYRIAKLNTSNGNVNSTFFPISGTGGFNDTVNVIAISPDDNSLYVGGNFVMYRGVANSARRIAKISTTDGSADASFHPVSFAGGYNSSVTSLLLDSTTHTLSTGGNFTTYRSSFCNFFCVIDSADGHAINP